MVRSNIIHCGKPVPDKCIGQGPLLEHGIYHLPWKDTPGTKSEDSWSMDNQLSRMPLDNVLRTKLFEKTSIYEEKVVVAWVDSQNGKPAKRLSTANQTTALAPS